MITGLAQIRHAVLGKLGVPGDLCGLTYQGPGEVPQHRFCFQSRIAVWLNRSLLYAPLAGFPQLVETPMKNTGKEAPPAIVLLASQEADEASAAIAAAHRGDVWGVNAAVCTLITKEETNESIVNVLDEALYVLKKRQAKQYLTPITPLLRPEELGMKWPPEAETAKVPKVAVNNLESLLASQRRGPSDQSGAKSTSPATDFKASFRGKATPGLFLFGMNGLKSELGVWGAKLLDGQAFIDKSQWFGVLQPFSSTPNRIAFIWRWLERPIQLQQDPWIGGLGTITLDSDGLRRLTATYDDGGAWAIDGAPMLHSRNDRDTALPANHVNVTMCWIAKGDHEIALYLYDHGGDWSFSLTLEKLVIDEAGSKSWVPERIVIKHGKSLESTHKVQVL